MPRVYATLKATALLFDGTVNLRNISDKIWVVESEELDEDSDKTNINYSYFDCPDDAYLQMKEVIKDRGANGWFGDCQEDRGKVGPVSESCICGNSDKSSFASSPIDIPDIIVVCCEKCAYLQYEGKLAFCPYCDRVDCICIERPCTKCGVVFKSRPEEPICRTCRGLPEITPPPPRPQPAPAPPMPQVKPMSVLKKPVQPPPVADKSLEVAGLLHEAFERVAKKEGLQLAGGYGPGPGTGPKYKCAHCGAVELQWHDVGHGGWYGCAKCGHKTYDVNE